MDYGSAMREIRLEKGKSLLDVQKGTGLAHQNISRWERNVVTPNIDACVKLAEYYGVSLEELIGLK